MKHVFPKFKLQLIKECSSLYEVDNVIDSPKSIYEIAINVLDLDKEPEEVICIIALSSKNKILGTFEVSRGSINNSVTSPREIFKRLILLNAVKFITLHNHPSCCNTPSRSDMVLSETLSEVGVLMGIVQLDFCILGDTLLSFKKEGLLD